MKRKNITTTVNTCVKIKINKEFLFVLKHYAFNNIIIATPFRL